MAEKFMNKKNIRDFRKVMRVFERLTAYQFKCCCGGVTLAQCHTLIEVEFLGSKATTVQLAQNLNLDKSTLSRTIDGLVNIGLVERLPNASDRRFLMIALTKQGKATCDTINRINDEYYGGVFQQIPKQKQNVVVKHFALLTQAFQDYENQRDREISCHDSGESNRRGKE
jgi:DNA-binding MarR family transcriptional regulator